MSFREFIDFDQEAPPYMERAVGPARPHWRIRAKEIAKEVADEYGLSENELYEMSRSAHLVEARHEAWLRVREALKLSYPSMSEVFLRDHTTIINGCRSALVRRQMRRKGRAAK